MKVAVLVPSDEYKSFAGARIRYHRIAPILAQRGIGLELHSISAFDPSRPDCDAILISKCHDARSLLIARDFSGRGKLVGVDLFDDYFADRRDSRLQRYRTWLKQLLGMSDFALCSTEVMTAVVREYRCAVPIHVMNDPAPDYDPEALAGLLDAKLAASTASNQLRVAWFGVGDNQYFQAGLADVAAYALRLADLSRRGMAVTLTIMTNRRALTAEGLALVSQLPVPVGVVEWSEAAEAKLLREALIAFLPVNFQPFSVAKSLNRAVTALTAGCQVLSAGYPLYQALDPFIYRDSGELLEDLGRGLLRHSSHRLDIFQDVICRNASADAEAEKLSKFLRGLMPRGPAAPTPIRVFHGHATRPEVHRLAGELGGLSVASPYCSASLDFDVLFRRAGGRLEMLVATDVLKRLLPKGAGTEGRAERIGRRRYRRLGKSEAFRPMEEAGGEEPFALQLATYANVIREMDRRLSDAFGPGPTLISEDSPWPFPLEDALEALERP